MFILEIQTYKLLVVESGDDSEWLFQHFSGLLSGSFWVSWASSYDKYTKNSFYSWIQSTFRWKAPKNFQSMMNANLNQHRIWTCHEDLLVESNPTIPQNSPRYRPEEPHVYGPKFMSKLCFVGIHHRLERAPLICPSGKLME